MANKISTTQALALADYFMREQRAGGFADLDLTDINWFELEEGERAKIWALIYNNPKALTSMLYEIGAKSN